MPPSFVNGTKLPISNQAALQASQAITPSILEYLWETNPGTRLLQEYLQPGIAMRIPTSTAGTGNGEILVGLQPIPKPETVGNGSHSSLSPFSSTPAATTTTSAAPSTTTGSTTPSAVPPLDPLTTPPPASKVHHTSTIIATHDFDPLQIRIHVPTDNAPSIQISSKGSNFSLTTRLPLAMTGSNDDNSISMDHNGGWMEVRYKRNAFWNGQVDFVASTWMTMDSLHALVQQAMTTNATNTTTTKGTTTTSVPMTWTQNGTPPKIKFQAGLEYQQSIVAVQTSLPLTRNVLAGNVTEVVPTIDTMVSINLNHRTPSHPSDSIYVPTSNFDHHNNNIDVVDDDDDDTTQVAPLWLSLKHSPSSSSSKWVMNLSQVLTFDRPVMNPFDERAPNIRQTLGWVVQVEKEPPTPTLVDHGIPITSSTSSNNTAKTSWSAGATFQLNRNTACKAVLMDGHTLLYGAILKRWSQPRLTLSLFHSLHLPTGQHGPFGFGLELETATPPDPTTTMPTHPKETTEYPPHPSLPSTHGPKTKIRIPKHTR